MTITVLRTIQYPLYEQRVLLEGREYLLTFDYSAREDRWYMTLADVDETPIYRGIKMVAKTGLLARCADRRKPPGELMVICPDGDPGYAQWGEEGTAQLVYYDESEIAALANGS